MCFKKKGEKIVGFLYGFLHFCAFDRQDRNYYFASYVVRNSRNVFYDVKNEWNGNEYYVYFSIVISILVIVSISNSQ